MQKAIYNMESFAVQNMPCLTLIKKNAVASLVFQVMGYFAEGFLPQKLFLLFLELIMDEEFIYMK